MLISIIAAKQPYVVSIAKPANELALERVMNVLDTRAGTGHVVRRASSLGDIVNHLKELKPGPGDHVQIVGHGTPGMLALGYFWSGVYADDGDTYALDSNLNMHGVLEGLVHPSASVWLVGCAVGEDRVGLVQCDGPTLIFDLARLWRCRVNASVGPVGEDDFDRSGRFLEVSPSTKALRVVTAYDRSVSGIPPQPPTGAPTRSLAGIAAVQEVKVLGPYATPERVEQVGRQLMQIHKIDIRELPDTPLLGLPEIVAKLADGTVATFLSNASIVQVTPAAAEGSANDRSYYAQVTALELQKAVRKAVRSAL